MVAVGVRFLSVMIRLSWLPAVEEELQALAVVVLEIYQPVEEVVVVPLDSLATARGRAPRADQIIRELVGLRLQVVSQLRQDRHPQGPQALLLAAMADTCLPAVRMGLLLGPPPSMHKAAEVMGITAVLLAGLTLVVAVGRVTCIRPKSAAE